MICSRVELKRLCEIFTRMFADPHSKVWLNTAKYSHKHAQLSLIDNIIIDSSFTHFF